MKLVVQNRRFLVPEAAREPNLASRALGAAVRALPDHWRARFGFAPLLAFPTTSCWKTRMGRSR